ncbi:MAG: hypothetical protein KJ914_05600 [Gammaproteobacteria bacterium]|nr:hypothetical protein [Gammaproteobacteria bacterium]MBU1723232.1 hypothetical protein [Gammaproteobacteria bacterium]MBU2007257.1 hypothetical protein [Gammaproteobacteria bacterium]
MTRSVLLVEGTTDKYFFELLLEKAGLTHVEVFPPKESGTRGRGINALVKEGIPKQLEEIKRGSVMKLGIVVDADSEDDDAGFANRHQAISALLESDFTLVVAQQEVKGSIFQRDDAPEIRIGLWIMPDCQEQGMLEDCLLPCIADPERTELLALTDASIHEVTQRKIFENIRFNEKHLSKVRFTTWLTWQQKPRSCRQLSPACALKEGWLNPDHPNITAITHWLQKVFQ